MASPSRRFQELVSRGRQFEVWERSKWKSAEHDAVEFEAPSEWQGKRGRIDLRLADSEEGYVVLVELKASDWDRMAPHRIRPNALRHARQLWRYIKSELSNRVVLPALVYPDEPNAPGRKEEIEGILNEWLIQVVWRGEDMVGF